MDERRSNKTGKCGILKIMGNLRTQNQNKYE
jgi:hypothetical protein